MTNGHFVPFENVSGQVSFEEDALRALIKGYCREAERPVSCAHVPFDAAEIASHWLGHRCV